MTLSEMIIEYREKNGLSQRQFALQCGISNGFISMLEKGVNPKTQKPVVPSLDILRKIANGMHMSINELLSTADELEIDISKKPIPENWDELDDRTKRFVELFTLLSPEQQDFLLAQLEGLASKL